MFESQVQISRQDLIHFVSPNSVAIDHSGFLLMTLSKEYTILNESRKRVH